MKIKTRLQLNVILSLILTVTIGLFVLFALQKMNAEIEKERTATEIVKGMAELKIVAHEYLLHPADRSLMQWNSTYDYLTKSVMKKANEFGSPAEKIALGKILKNVSRFKAAFNNVTTSFGKEQGSGRQERAISPDLRDRLISELLVISQSTVPPVFQLQQVIQTELMAAQQKSSLLIVIFIIILAFFVIAISLWINRSIARPLSELEKDIRIIGSGNLDHKVGTAEKDEIGQLSRSFDMMTGDLKETTASIVELNKEIEHRKQAEEALRESEEKYRTVLESNPEPVVVYDMEGRVIYLNPAFTRVFGWSLDEQIGKKIDNFVPEENWPETKTMINRVTVLGESFSSLETHRYTKEGDILDIRISGASYRNQEGNVAASIINLRDVTAQKRLEDELQQVTKMETVATLAGGVAHEFNNALMGVMGNIELLKWDFPEDERKTKYLEAMNESGHRMSRLTDQLLAYAEGGQYNPTDLKLDDFVIETLPILQHDLSPAVRVETHFPKVSYIRADQTQMQMVLSTILTNSNEAMGDKGLIRITTENKDLDEDFTKEHTGLKPGSYVCLTIEDDGKGMDEETKNGIFEPFFTTKFQGRGMGMAAVYGIIKSHDGAITVDSEPGKGTVVRVYLPAISEESREQRRKAVKEPEVEIAMGEGTILVIEDEEPLVDLFRQILERLGYRVLLAETGKEAVELAKTFDGQIDLALLDIKLPDMDGGRVYPLIMEARPDMKVIVCSGYSIHGPAQDIIDAGAEGFIQKPFNIAPFAEKLKEVLEGK